mmetsp:Transcript_11150/g.35415  ORF Transcript_11150/g.35415 Transcript_11150/m.35415 type:complete len:314 (+) Transcript_11150:124-1065(+)
MFFRHEPTRGGNLSAQYVAAVLRATASSSSQWQSMRAIETPCRQRGENGVESNGKSTIEHTMGSTSRDDRCLHRVSLPRKAHSLEGDREREGRGSRTCCETKQRAGECEERTRRHTGTRSECGRREGVVGAQEQESSIKQQGGEARRGTKREKSDDNGGGLFQVVGGDEVVVGELARGLGGVGAGDGFVEFELGVVLGGDGEGPEAGVVALGGGGGFLGEALVVLVEEGVGVVAHDAEDGEAGGEAEFHAAEALGVGEEGDVRVGHAALGEGVHGGGHADLAPAGPLHGGGGFAEGAAVAAEGVEEGVGARVV